MLKNLQWVYNNIIQGGARMQGIGIGESDFKILRTKDYYFIDKSLFIKHILVMEKKLLLK